MESITSLKMRQLDVVVARMRKGLASGVNYGGHAIAGFDLISEESITAAQNGHVLPPVPSARYYCKVTGVTVRKVSRASQRNQINIQGGAFNTRIICGYNTKHSKNFCIVQKSWL